MDIPRAYRRLRQLDTATSLQALSALNSVGLHKLKGDKRDFWSVDVNAQWRILFRFRDGDAYDVHILDPH
jgi:toxin HigB-1